MKIKYNGTMRILIPDEEMHLKCTRCGDIYDGEVYLGTLDSPEYYIEVTEEEYQQFLQQETE